MEHKKSENIRLFLENKLNDCERKIIKMKRRRKIIKIIYGCTIIVSISVSAVAVAVSGAYALPLVPKIIIICSSCIGVISTAISTKFNLKNKKDELKNMLLKLDQLKQQLNYVISCNGSLTQEDSIKIVKQFI